jgi:hypothetical protein
LKLGIVAAGLVTVAQFSFWGNYLPRVYPTHLRGTGESFAANVGGRMIGTSAALATTQLATVLPGEPARALSNACALVALGALVLAAIVTRWLPEPARAELPE